MKIYIPTVNLWVTNLKGRLTVGDWGSLYPYSCLQKKIQSCCFDCTSQRGKGKACKSGKKLC